MVRPARSMSDGRRLVRKCVAAAAAAVLLISGGQPVFAQGLIDLVPRQEFTDERGVDVLGAVYRHHENLLRIGGGEHPLELTLNFTSPGMILGVCPDFGEGDVGNATYHALNSHAYYGHTGLTGYTVVLPHQSAKFIMYGTSSNWTLVPDDGSYVTGSVDPTLTYFNYIGGDGTEATFSTLHTAQPVGQNVTVWASADQVRFPDGETWTYRYNDVQYLPPGSCGVPRVSRVRSIISSRGYGIQFDYGSDATGTVTSREVIQNWVSPVRATAYNKVAVHCDEAALVSCASVAALSSTVLFAYDRPNRRVTVTKPNGEEVQFTFTLSDTLNLTNVTRPGGVTRTMGYENGTDQDGPSYRYLSTLTEAGRTWGYNGMGPTYEVGAPSGARTIYYASNGVPYMILDPLSRQTSINYDGYLRFHGAQYPEGNQVVAAYDARGNLNLLRQIPKAGSGLPTLEATAVFPVACIATDRRSCNRPISTTDFNGNTTDRTYSPDHGGPLTVTGPAVPTRQNDGSLANVRPQKRYEYAQRYAWISNGSGGYVQAAAPVWLLVRERSCRTTAASGSGCAGGALDETVTDYDYGPNAGPNNLLLRGVAVTADSGTGLVTLRTCYGYNQSGNRVSETQPNANLGSCP